MIEVVLWQIALFFILLAFRLYVTRNCRAMADLTLQQQQDISPYLTLLQPLIGGARGAGNYDEWMAQQLEGGK